MPTYEYQCKKCKHKFEKFQSMNESHVKKCPECKGPVVRLIGTGAGIIFKGKGFYQTDYKPSSSASKKFESGSSDAAQCGKAGSCGSCAG